MQRAGCRSLFSIRNSMKYVLKDEIDSSGGQPINVSTLSQISSKVLRATLTPDTIKARFDKTGIAKFIDEENENEEDINVIRFPFLI